MKWEDICKLECVVLDKNVSVRRFVQEDISRYRIANRNYSYQIWRRFKGGKETWLGVMWHENWKQGRKGSDFIVAQRDPITGRWKQFKSYLKEDVEKWLIALLHHAGIYDFDEMVHKDFEELTHRPAFNS